MRSAAVSCNTDVLLKGPVLTLPEEFENASLFLFLPWVWPIEQDKPASLKSEINFHSEEM